MYTCTVHCVLTHLLHARVVGVGGAQVQHRQAAQAGQCRQPRGTDVPGASELQAGQGRQLRNLQGGRGQPQGERGGCRSKVGWFGGFQVVGNGERVSCRLVRADSFETCRERWEVEERALLGLRWRWMVRSG